MDFSFLKSRGGFPFLALLLISILLTLGCDDSGDDPQTDALSSDAASAEDAISSQDATDAAHEDAGDASEDGSSSDATPEDASDASEDGSSSDATLADAGDASDDGSSSDAAHEDAGDASEDGSSSDASEDAGDASEDATVCPANTFGSQCTPCTCVHGTCNDGLNGDGKCTDECEPPYGGDNCDLCTNGGFGASCDKICTRPGGQYDQATASDCQITDARDGETYQVVQIGDQVWMAENYRRDTGRNFRIGFESGTESAENDKLYGRRYDHATATAEDFCPAGWHLPTEGEFNQLEKYAVEHKTSEYTLQALIANSTRWGDGAGNDDFGFSAMPAGMNQIKDNGNGVNEASGRNAYFWASYPEDEEFLISFELSLPHQMAFWSPPYNGVAISVRCIMDHPCAAGQFGKFCEPCNCVHGICDEGDTGSGCLCDPGFGSKHCDQCDEDHFGPDCDHLYGSVTDQEGNRYKTVEIAGRTWMAENYRREIGHHYKGGEDWVETYGFLYDFDTVTARGFCPEGWRMPTLRAFKELLEEVKENRTSSSDLLALIAKSPLWFNYPDEGLDEFGFGALPAGTCNVDLNEDCNATHRGEASVFWSLIEDTGSSGSDPQMYPGSFGLIDNVGVTLSDAASADEAFSVRCVQKRPPCPERGFFGENCDQPVTCSEHGTADEGPDGNGQCTACEPGWFGENCESNKVTCSEHGTPSLGPAGNGQCSECEPEWAGPNCEKKVTCSEHGTPSLGITGNGQCSECEQGYFGKNCDSNVPTCSEHGTPSLGATGNGKCSECEQGYFGENCESNETTCSEHGTPSLGPQGNGKCIPGSCEALYGGENCDRCVNGRFGAACDKICTRPGGQYDQATASDCQITDARDGETYQVVQIDDRVWMAENYRRAVGHHYKGINNWIEAYGFFYDFETVTADDFCPEGWRMPTTKEFEALLNYVKQHRTGSSNTLALIAKSLDWEDFPNQGQDEFGFGALPSGLCWGTTVSGDDCSDVFRGERANFLSLSDPQATPATFVINETSAMIVEHGDTNWINSVRCIQKRTSCPEPGWFGSECDQKITCSVHGTANEDPEGDGHCTACESGWFGPNCDREVTCSAHGIGTPNDGPDGDGHCSACKQGWYGDNCDLEEPPCVHGTPDSVLGHCSSCSESGWAGPDCDREITCSEHGTPSLGPNGDGHCSACEPGYYGKNCDHCVMTGERGSCFVCTRPDGNYDQADASTCSITDTHKGQTDTYQIVTIGDQVWMAENSRRRTGSYTHANNSEANDSIHGLLYDHFYPTSCPAGWHVPSQEEFQTLLDYATEHTTEGIRALVGESDQGTDELGFNILLSGRAGFYLTDETLNFGSEAYFWTDSNFILTVARDSWEASFEYKNSRYAYSVRCIKDDPYPEDHFGQNRTPCTCQHGICNDGRNGDGLCLSCESGWYGDNCDLEEPPCVHGTPDSGLGHCSSCNESGWFGRDCEKEVTCEHGIGTPREGPDGDGTCTACESGWFGPDCKEEVTCAHGTGTPNEGPDGDGTCIGACEPGYRGKNCDHCVWKDKDGDCLICTRPGGEYDQADASDCQLTETRDGQTETYQIVQIGDKLWMGENYRRKTDDYYGHANNSEENDDIYGLLYNRPTIQAEGFCPAGWHVSTREDFLPLSDYANAHGALTLLARSPAWNQEPDQEPPGTDDLGFGALPAGYFYKLKTENLDEENWKLFGKRSFFWAPRPGNEPGAYACSDALIDANQFKLSYETGDNYYKSVRCVMDPPCSEGFFGANCDQPCTCKHGICRDGQNGDGQCIACEQGWYGDNCDQQ